MSLISCYEKDVEDFAKEYGRPIDRLYFAEPLVPRALDLVKKLFYGAEIEEASDGSVLVALNSGKVLALICLPQQSMNARAVLVGETYFIAVNVGVIRLLFNLSRSIWKDNRFMSHLENLIRDFSELTTDFIPLGFEEIFLHDTFKITDEIRYTIFYQCFEKSLSFFWLHEVAHVFCGHTDACKQHGKPLGIIDEFLNAMEFDEDELDESMQKAIPYHAFEIQADRWALDRLFKQLHQQVIAGSANDIHLLYTVIGCTLFPLLSHGYNLLRNKADLAKYHPPLWFRADEVILAEDKAANEQWFGIEKKIDKRLLQ